jgi:hypothetical protein
LFSDQLRNDVGHHLVGGGVRAVAEALDWLAAVVIAHYAAEADHRTRGVALHRRDGLVHGDWLRAKDRGDHLE